MQQAARESGLFLFTDIDLKFDTPQYRVQGRRRQGEPHRRQHAGRRHGAVDHARRQLRQPFNLYGRSYEVIPQAPREFRLTPDWLTRYEVRTTNGELVPLSTVASVSQTVQPNALTSFQQLNSATLSGVPFPGRTLGEALDFLKAKSKEIFPEGYTYDFQGDSRQYEQEGNALVYAFVFALIIIYLVLAAQFESFRDPLIILIALPTAMFGALLPLNIGGVLGVDQHQYLYADRPRDADRPDLQARHPDGRFRQSPAGSTRACRAARRSSRRPACACGRS